MKKSYSAVFAILGLFLAMSITVDENKQEGIIFFDGSWADVLKKSQNEHKLIFLDLSTSWCKYCKLLHENIYPNQKVGDYFNRNFICVELSAEQGDGMRLAQKYGVSSYPTLLIVDKNENAVFTSEGYHEPDDLIEVFKRALKAK
jgi:thioredoxin 1